MKAVCPVCFRRCALEEGETGACRARENRSGSVVPSGYGLLTALALDPIEKKPLRRFFPGSMVLSCGGFGCNLRCPFCQNYEISQKGKDGTETTAVSPEELVARALALKSRGNIGIAYTYNEPLVCWEYVRDCAALVRKNGMKNILVSNASASESVFREVLPLLDAANLDLKCFSEAGYRKLGGDLETVKRNIAITANSPCRLELTALIVPGLSDGEAEMEALSAWVADLSPEIPLHVTRYFPRWKAEGEPTPRGTVLRMAEIASKHLRYVYPGNL